MKNILLLLTITSLVYSQTLFLEENFDYSTGTLTVNTSNWVESPTGSTDIQVSFGNLNYLNYSSSDIGNLIILDGGASGRSGVYRKFTKQYTVGITVYFSFLINVTSTSDMDINTSNGDYFFNSQNDTMSNIRNFIYVRQGSNSSKFNVGLAKASSTSLQWFSTELDINTTYLFVTSYTFVSGSNNDIVKLWINPNLSGVEPSPDISISSGSDATDIALLQFRQNAKSGDMQIDGIRVSDSWSQAPLPVQLTSFTADLYYNNVKLNWSTATEVNNYGFEIERNIVGTKLALSEKGWEKIGFVHGHGNSNSSKDYTFVDVNPPSGKVQYKLKQIDFDGTFECSSIVEVDIDTPQNFILKQNYPNPFNPTTTIKYTLPAVILQNAEQSNNDYLVTLKVFDILGNEVATLVNEIQSAGNYEVKFDASKLSSGIYIYKLQTGKFLQTRKMLLVK
ncbi:MAG: T9SS type A sorting domain-containing protein [Stygiobacter sp.]|jgi:hypothetical protein|uniref:T9SS type A sorting domain-containing protein n=1 Tax=Stygiobacter electus TaxID=3032292 RepID=A0AAE3TE07_9BACT|nr:T9SS type A sorting domain-containing protein [Stygiobacter electus]MDF1611763.1 T9SS type A sorting domain-containing protein [Stygiobacter electus]